MIIAELMTGIRNLDFVLPEFQREYVWELKQAKQLLVSLFRGYPTGSLLFWKTTDPPEIKNNAIDADKIGSTIVILDGQQRLTTLYLQTQNAIPPYYTEPDITHDPRNLYFDLATGDFQYYQTSRMDKTPTWVAVTDCFAGDEINVFAIAQALAEDDATRLELSQTLNSNLNRLKNILQKDYPIQTVPSGANIDNAIDVFDRVNSLGTKLTEAELALAHICGKWSEARRVMKKQIEHYSSQRFYFDLTFMVRSLTAVVKGRALFETIHDASLDELTEGWKKLTEILDYLIGVLLAHASIHSTEDLNTQNVLVPLVTYLSRKKRFGTDKELRRAIHWLYAASTWARYTSQTNQRLDHDLSIVLRSATPWSELVSAIIDQRGRIELAPDDLEGRSPQHPMYRMAYILAKARGAIDWCNGHPLHVRQAGRYAVHSHHIFPVSRLYNEGGYDKRNHLHKKLVNEVANRAFLTGDTNWSLSADRPSEYIPEIQEKYPGALEKQFIPTSPELWRMENYEDFLKERRKLMASAYNEVMAELSTGVPEEEPLSIGELIAAGESATLEFKSSLRWDMRQRQVNKGLQKVIAKAVGGFLNTEGGTLLIGVADDGAVLGIGDDIASTGRRDRDGFLQALYQTFANHLGESVSPQVDVSFDTVDSKEICRVKVESSQHPVYFTDGQVKEFYIRFGSSTRALDVEKAQEYIAVNWG